MKAKPKNKMKNFDLEKFKNYVNTYDTQIGFKNYSKETVINDFIYGIGICINEEEYKNADGFKRFKKYLSKHFGIEECQNKCNCE